MKRNTPLRSDPAKISAWQRRSKPLRNRGARSDREALDLVAVRTAVHSRVWCELGPPACEPERHEGHHAHHVVMRSQGGGHDPSNGLLVCFMGHRFVHDNPAVSYERGWLGRRSA